jgi:hypothetical protein
MNKKTLLLPFLLLGLTTACSTKNSTEVVSVEHIAESSQVVAKPKKHRRHTLPEGVISADIVNYDNRLHLLTGKNKQGNKSLWYQYSIDGGENWSVEESVLNDENISVKMTRGNDAQIAAQGKNIVITWTQHDKSARFHAGAMLAARSTDEGESWQYSEIPPDWKQGPHGFIDMAADKNAMHAVWLDSRSGRSDINASQGLRHARSIDGGLSWQKNNTLDQLTCSCCWNTIKTNADKAYVLYRDKQPSDLSIGVINSQQQWHRLNHVGAFNWQFDGCPHIGGGLDFQTTANKTRLHAVVGTGHQEHLGIHYLYSDDAGKNWSASKQLGDESAIHADIAAHNNGRVVAVWDMMGEEGLAIFMAESKDQGVNWSEPKQISKKGLRATHPRIVKTESGFLSLWTENNGHLQSLATKRI